MSNLQDEIRLGKQFTFDMKPGKNILKPLCAICGETLRQEGKFWRCDHCARAVRSGWDAMGNEAIDAH
jgi:tRNA(Ile2) C34 agmatinyltransferase TiaS